MRTFALLFIGLCCSQVTADEPLDWRIVGPSAIEVAGEEPLSWSVVGPCHCRAGGPCVCGQDCRCESAPHGAEIPKPVVFAYKDFRLTCPGCQRLDREADALPVQLEWKAAPAWVRSYPTLHWRGENGRWYQYQWGLKNDDITGFRRVWEATHTASAPIGGPGKIRASSNVR